MFGDSLRDLLVSRPSNHKKTLRQILTNLSHEILATWADDLFATHSSREKHVFCNLRVIFRQFSKTFHFSLAYCDCSLSPSSKLTMFFQKSSIFFIISSSIFKKRYGFSIFPKVFHISSLRFLGFCVFVEFWEYDVEYGLWIFCWVWCLGFVNFW